MGCRIDTVETWSSDRIFCHGLSGNTPAATTLPLPVVAEPDVVERTIVIKRRVCAVAIAGGGGVGVLLRLIVGCLRCLLLVMCAYPFANKVLTLLLARGEGRERYFGCNLMQRKVLASSHQHLMAEAPPDARHGLERVPGLWGKDLPAEPPGFDGIRDSRNQRHRARRLLFIHGPSLLGGSAEFARHPQPRGRKPVLRREIPWILRGFQGRLSC